MYFQRIDKKLESIAFVNYREIDFVSFIIKVLNMHRAKQRFHVIPYIIIHIFFKTLYI